MKKIILIMSAILVLFALINKQEEDYYVIPEEAIRLRIIANSNSVEDQYIKNKVKINIEEELKNTISTNSSIETSRLNIIKSIPKYEKIINDTFLKEEYKKEFSIDYGYNYFPEKEYKGVIYEEGKYESLLITIGEGKGDNWWCVLFPPLCTLEVEEREDIEYRFFIKDIFDKYLK